MWAGVEPEPGQFNKTYVNILKEIVEKYKSDQIYFIMDMHQDVLWETPGLVTLFHLFVDIILAIQFNFSYFSIKEIVRIVLGSIGVFHIGSRKNWIYHFQDMNFLGLSIINISIGSVVILLRKFLEDLANFMTMSTE